MAVPGPPVTATDCSCKVMRLGGQDRLITAPSCPVHGTLEGRAATDEAARSQLQDVWTAGWESGWNDRNRIALGIHNQPPTPNPYIRKTEP